jgi:hypothetical protein
MIDRPSSSRSLLLGAAVLAIVAVGWLLVRTERRVAQLEAQLARTAAAPRPAERSEAPPARRWVAAAVDQPALAEPAREAPPPRRARQLAELQAPAQPKMPEARKFAEDQQLDEQQWRTLTRLNAYWMDALQKAEKDGEDALPDKLDSVARQRDIKLHAVLGSDEGVASYREFEGSLTDNRVTFKGKDGTFYGAAPFE